MTIKMPPVSLEKIKRVTIVKPFKQLQMMFIFFVLLSGVMFGAGCAASPQDEIVIIKSILFYRNGQLFLDDYLEKLIEQAKPGDSIIIPNGVYENLRVPFRANGSPEKPITLKAETPGKVILTGKSRIRISGEHLIVSGINFNHVSNGNVVLFNKAKNCRLTECVFIMCGDHKRTSAHIVRLENNSKNNTIDHCYMRRNLSIGIGISLSPLDSKNTGNTIRHSYFYDIQRRAENGQEAIQIGQSKRSHFIGAHTVVEHCLFEKVDADAEIISSKSSSNIFRHNMFKNCNGNLVLRGGNSAVVDGNFFVNTGLRIHGEGHIITNNYFKGNSVAIDIHTGTGIGKHAGPYQAVSNCLIAHNTVINAGEIGIYIGRNKGKRRDGYVWDKAPSNISFLNNIIAGNRGMLIHNEFSENLSWNKNIVWPGGTGKIGLMEIGLLEVDPHLTNDETSYRLSLDSRFALDQGAPLVEVTTDIDGQQRDSEPDIGCDELSSKDVVFVPPDRNKATPSWLEGIDEDLSIPLVSES